MTRAYVALPYGNVGDIVGDFETCDNFLTADHAARLKPDSVLTQTVLTLTTEKLPRTFSVAHSGDKVVD